MRSVWSVPLISALACALATGVAPAEIPQQISYQGMVTDTVDSPVADGTYTRRFRIYDAATGGNAQGDGGDQSVSASGGAFSVMMGEGNPIALAFDEDYWIEVVIHGDTQSPRERLGSAGYAYMAGGMVPGTEVAGSVESSTSGSLKAVNTSTGGTRYGGYFTSASPLGKGVYCEAPHTGVHGKATASSGVSYGGSFLASSEVGRGVYAQTLPYGIYGLATGTAGVSYGGWFESVSPSGKGVHGEGPHTGVYGKATSTEGVHYGGSFINESSSGRGVHGQAALHGIFGLATGTAGVNYGGWFESASASGKGVHGEAPHTGVDGKATATAGVHYGGSFLSNSEDGRGVHAQSPHIGVYGMSTGAWGVHDGGTFVSQSPQGMGDYAETTFTNGSAAGVMGHTASLQGIGVHGWASHTQGMTYGVFGETASPNGAGVLGEATSTSPTSVDTLCGGRFETTNKTGFGVYGLASSTEYSPTSIAVLGEHKSTTGPATAGKFITHSLSGTALWAEAIAPTTNDAHALKAQVTSEDGAAIRVWSLSTRGSAYAIHAGTNGEESVAKRGFSYSTTPGIGTAGVEGEATADYATGVYGLASSIYGDCIGVVGQALSSMGFGVYYSGGIGGTGPMKSIVRTTQGPGCLGVHSTAGSWVEDIGGSCPVQGRAYVELDPIFLETVTITEEHPMRVFIQLNGVESSGVAVKKHQRGFEILELNGGRSSVPFDYRVLAE